MFPAGFLATRSARRSWPWMASAGRDVAGVGKVLYITVL